VRALSRKWGADPHTRPRRLRRDGLCGRRFMSLLRSILVFVVFSRQMIAGLMEGAVKG
jgi:hypothetical protein